MDSLYKFILRRPFFRGQDRFFNYLFRHSKLGRQTVRVKPLEGNFKINCDPLTWIGAKIIYTGDYEPALKKIFRSVIKKGDHVLDIGANIGFHSLYFAELVGPNGIVTSFEPVPVNYRALSANIEINKAKNIISKNMALGSENETFSIRADENSDNPGAYNLFDKEGNIAIECRIGDEIVLKNERVDFIKIDVEGYESFVIKGLIQTITKHKPVIIFEYDRYYHKKTNLPEGHIFLMLGELGYTFQYILNNRLQDITSFQEIKSANILACPNA
jgi:FkbM family methyltransferase